jgi:hypothetical protein
MSYLSGLPGLSGRPDEGHDYRGNPLSTLDLAISDFNVNLAKGLAKLQNREIKGYDFSEICEVLRTQEELETFVTFLSLPRDAGRRIAFLDEIRKGRTDARFSDAACVASSRFRERWREVRKKLVDAEILRETEN